MPELRVPEDRRPSLAKYVGMTLGGFLLVGGTVATALSVVDSPGAGVLGVALAGLAGLAILFAMIQSLVQEWFAAAEIVAE